MFDFLSSLFGAGANMGLMPGQALGPQGAQGGAPFGGLFTGLQDVDLQFDPANGGKVSAAPMQPQPMANIPQPTAGFSGVQPGTWGGEPPAPQPKPSSLGTMPDLQRNPYEASTPPAPIPMPRPQPGLSRNPWEVSEEERARRKKEEEEKISGMAQTSPLLAMIAQNRWTA